MRDSRDRKPRGPRRTQRPPPWRAQRRGDGGARGAGAQARDGAQKGGAKWAECDAAERPGAGTRARQAGPRRSPVWRCP